MPTRISIIMANWNCQAFLDAAIRSVQQQTVEDWELVIADDGSSDDSVAVATRFAEEDSRIRVLEPVRGGSPASARNRALESATGDWLAIMDSDDTIRPDRFERLLELADQQRADIVADNLRFFGDPETEGQFLLDGYRGIGPWLMGPEEFLVAHFSSLGMPQLGYLKPMIRRSVLGGLRYDETLRVGEDTDILLKLMMTGAKVIVTPASYYDYRRHAGSVSRRWHVEDLRSLIASQKRMLANANGTLAELMAGRLSKLERLLAVEKVVADLKARNFVAVAGALLRHPILLPRITTILGEALRRRAALGAVR